jgi:Domain of unknown function (DUF4397)
MPYRFTVASSAAALVSIALVAACGGDNTTAPEEAANVRVVNASPTTTTISAANEGRTVAFTLNYQNTNAPANCGLVEQDNDARLDFGNGGNGMGLARIEFPFAAQQNYTVVLFGPNNATVFPDVFTAPAAGNNAIRFINATGTAGDVYLTTPTANIVGPPTVANLAAGQASGFNASSAPGGTFSFFSTDNTRVRLFDPGVTTGTPRADFTISNLPANRVATVVLAPPPVGGSTTAFMVNPCGG